MGLLVLMVYCAVAWAGHLESLNRKLIMAGGGTELERRKSWRYRTAWDATAQTVKEQNPDLLASTRVDGATA